MRSTLNEIYFGKTQFIVNSLRSMQSQTDQDKQNRLKLEIADALKGRQELQQKRQHSKEEN